ncbi:MAG: effector-associated domain EAD1-containing protein, partial [Promethearchaeota archaeon]
AFPLEILLWPYKGVYHVAYDGVCTEFIRKLSESLIEYAPGWNKKIYIVLPSGFDNLPEEDRHGHKTFVSLIKHVQRDVKEVEDMPELRPEYDFQDEDGIRVTLSIREKPEIHGRDKPIEKTRPSIWNQDLRKLRDLLCLLYTKTKDCERVVEDVKLNTTDIDFSGKVVNIWQDILKEAAKNKQVKAIIRYALKKYPNFERREELEELLKASTFS